MDTLNAVEILKMGLPGLVLLLSFLSYGLLSKEQSKENPREVVLKSIKQFMYLNFVFAGLTVAAPLVEKQMLPPPAVTTGAQNPTPFATVAMVGEVPTGSAEVCHGTDNANRYWVVGNAGRSEYIQVFARGVLPCTDKTQITINALDAKKTLKWPQDIDQKDVQATVAPLGFKFNPPPMSM